MFSHCGGVEGGGGAGRGQHGLTTRSRRHEHGFYASPATSGIRDWGGLEVHV